MTTVYVGLGGNIGDMYATLQSAIERIKKLPDVSDVETSSFYRTAPVSPVPQPDYLNAVCRFKTTTDANTLLTRLQEIEVCLGKIPKPKTDPRPVDLDMLFYGDETSDAQHLLLPHPEWKNRLFVLVPLSDLTDRINVPGPGGRSCMNIAALINSFCETERLQIRKY